MTSENTPWTRDCKPGDTSICANIVEGGSGDVELGEQGDPIEGHDHFCKHYPNQIVVKGLDVDPDDFDLDPIDPEDLYLFGVPDDEGVRAAQGVFDLFAEGEVRIFKTRGADPAPVELLEIIDQIHAAGFEASPHYLVQPAPTWKYGPHSTVGLLDPQWEWSDLYPTGPSSDEPARLIVIDTGGNGDLSEIGISFAEPEPPLPQTVWGHGGFVASIAKQFNPELEVEIYRAGLPDGTLSEASVALAFQRANPGSDVVNLSLGTYPCADGYLPLGLPIAVALAGSHRVVAASGNDGINHFPQQLYPASLPDVIGVSAYDVSWGKATWANPGEVYRPGEDVVGWYHDGQPGSTSSLAVWSGTSFAAPHYAACLASGVC